MYTGRGPLATPIVVTMALVAIVLTSCRGSEEPTADVAVDFETEPQVVTFERIEPEPTTTAAPTTTLPPTTPTTEPIVQAQPVVPVAADDPVGLAAQILEAETAIRDPETPAHLLAEASLLQQIAYRQLGNHPEWDEAVLAEIPAELSLAVSKNAQARREFRGMHTKLQDHLPPWHIVEPASAADLLGYYREAEAEFGIAWQYLAAINLVETGMGRIRGTSVAGAQGPMQFMPATWDAFGDGDINDPRDAIFAAARYLRHNGGHEGNIEGALWNYNRHDNYVRGVMAYADVMFEDPQAFHGFYHWQVVYLTVRGDIVLFPGYQENERVHVDEWLARQD